MNNPYPPGNNIMDIIFFTGLQQPVNGPSGCQHFDYCVVSINRLIDRKSDFPVNNWILDSGAFTRITSGKGHLSTRQYAKLIERWSRCGNLMAAVSQDYMCEPFVLGITGLNVEQHQKATVARYKHLKRVCESGIYIMPVLQGYEISEYLRHIEMYGKLLARNAWVGLGSVCKRNSDPRQIEYLLIAIKKVRPDLRLHGFGLKKTSLASGVIRELLWSADSQAHSFRPDSTGRKFRTANDPIHALQYAKSILDQPVQTSLLPRLL